MGGWGQHLTSLAQPQPCPRHLGEGTEDTPGAGPLGLGLSRLSLPALSVPLFSKPGLGNNPSTPTPPLVWPQSGLGLVICHAVTVAGKAGVTMGHHAGVEEEGGHPGN